MNTISIIDKLCMWLLQQQNVKRDVIERKIINVTTKAVAPDLNLTDGAVGAGTVVGAVAGAGAGAGAVDVAGANNSLS